MMRWPEDDDVMTTGLMMIPAELTAYMQMDDPPDHCRLKQKIKFHHMYSLDGMIRLEMIPGNL